MPDVPEAFIVSQGSKDPNNRALGPKYYNINGIWALKPPYLGPWTPRGLHYTMRPTREPTTWRKPSAALAALALVTPAL